MALEHFNQFIASLESMNMNPDVDQLSMKDQYALDSVYGTVKNFITETNLVPADQIAAMESFEQPMRSFNRNVSLADIGTDRIIDLCRQCGITDNNLKAACESVSLAIHNYTNGYNAAQHFNSAAPSGSHGELDVRKFDTLFTSRAVDTLLSTPQAALEAFGADIANTISDAKVAITVSILRYHRSALHRLIPNIPTDSNMVTYKIDFMEVYDLTKSRANDAATRYDTTTRIPFVELYNNPSPANMELKPINLLVANDAAAPNNLLIAENIVKIGMGLNMFDYSLEPGVIGYDHIDYTDLVGDNVRLESLLLQVTNGTTTEQIPLTVVDQLGARMLMNANNLDSGDRVCNLQDITSINNQAVTLAGTATALMSSFSSDFAVKLAYTALGSINLKTSQVVVHGSVQASPVTVSGNPPIAADVTLFDTLTFSIIGYSVDAEFSEENIRKTTKAMRIMTKQVGYEIPGSANFVVQYSLTQTRPESVIDGLTKLMSIGIDDRGLKLIQDTMNNVFDRLIAEAALTSDNYVYKVGNDYVAGQRVKPYIWMDTIDISQAKNIRSGDFWGDVRAYAESYLLNVFSRVYRESYYQQELGQGEKPVFSVLTSIAIKDSLLAVPHYHNHLADTAADAVADGVVEFRRPLPDGTILNVITTTFNYMDDKILIVPVRPNRPQSVLNFAHNRERGTYLTQATPTVDNAIFNSLIGNAREIVIPTNPVGALITVSNLSTIFNGLGVLG